MNPYCVVVGGGPAGLAAAWKLKTFGIRTTVFEAEPDAGGRTRNLTVNGAVANYGASFLASFYSESIELARQIGVELSPSKLRPGHSGRVHRLFTPRGPLPHSLASPVGFFRFPLLGYPAKIRSLSMLLSIVLGRRTHIADPSALAHFDEEDAERWGRRLFGDDGFEYVVRIALEPFFYFSSAQCSAAFARALLQQAPHWRPLIPSGGMGKFCKTLASGLDVRCGAKVTGIQRDNENFLIHHGRGAERATHVILALPADKALLLRAPIQTQDRKVLEQVPYLPCVRAMLGYRQDRSPRLPYITPAGPGKHPLISIATLSTWEPGRVPKGQEIIWMSAAGWRGVELIGEEPRYIIEALMNDARVMQITLPPPDWSNVLINSQGMVVPMPGHFRRTADFLARKRTGIYFAGDWLTGSTVEGAIRTGYLAAEAVRDEISARSQWRINENCFSL